MKILMLLPQWPFPPNQGAKLRNAGLARILAEVHEVHALSFGEGEALGPFRRAYFVPASRRSGLARALDMLRTSLPDLALRMWSRDFRGRLAALLAAERFDAVHASNLEMGIYLRFVPGGPVRVFDDHNAEYVLQRRAVETARQRLPGPARLYSVVQWRRLRRFEADTCCHADRVLAVSADDAARLAALDARIQPCVVPNALELEHHPFQPRQQASRPMLMFSGKLDYRPNADAARWFIDEILPLVWRNRPEARFLVVGQAPPAWLVEHGKRDPRIVITGPVEDDRPYLARSAAYVLPMRWGGGVRFKALVALASGSPLISTTLGVEGLGCASGRDALIADEPVGFARAVVEVLERPDVATGLAGAGRTLVEGGYTLTSIAPALLDAYASLGDRAAKRAGRLA
jgi:glycosyltransferase involved in cell wall biosynthesis